MGWIATKMGHRGAVKRVHHQHRYEDGRAERRGEAQAEEEAAPKPNTEPGKIKHRIVSVGASQKRLGDKVGRDGRGGDRSTEGTEGRGRASRAGARRRDESMPTSFTITCNCESA